MNLDTWVKFLARKQVDMNKVNVEEPGQGGLDEGVHKGKINDYTVYLVYVGTDDNYDEEVENKLNTGELGYDEVDPNTLAYYVELEIQEQDTGMTLRPSFSAGNKAKEEEDRKGPRATNQTDLGSLLERLGEDLDEHLGGSLDLRDALIGESVKFEVEIPKDEDGEEGFPEVKKKSIVDIDEEIEVESHEEEEEDEGTSGAEKETEVSNEEVAEEIVDEELLEEKEKKVKMHFAKKGGDWHKAFQNAKGDSIEVDDGVVVLA